MIRDSGVHRLAVPAGPRRRPPPLACVCCCCGSVSLFVAFVVCGAPQGSMEIMDRPWPSRPSSLSIFTWRCAGALVHDRLSVSRRCAPPSESPADDNAPCVDLTCSSHLHFDIIPFIVVDMFVKLFVIVSFVHVISSFFDTFNLYQVMFIANATGRHLPAAPTADSFRLTQPHSHCQFQDPCKCRSPNYPHCHQFTENSSGFPFLQKYLPPSSS